MEEGGSPISRKMKFLIKITTVSFWFLCVSTLYFEWARECAIIKSNSLSLSLPSFAPSLWDCTKGQNGTVKNIVCVRAHWFETSFLPRNTSMERGVNNWIFQEDETKKERKKWLNHREKKKKSRHKLGVEKRKRNKNWEPQVTLVTRAFFFFFLLKTRAEWIEILVVRISPPAVRHWTSPSPWIHCYFYLAQLLTDVKSWGSGVIKTLLPISHATTLSTRSQPDVSAYLILIQTTITRCSCHYCCFLKVRGGNKVSESVSPWQRRKHPTQCVSIMKAIFYFFFFLRIPLVISQWKKERKNEREEEREKQKKCKRDV